MTTDKMKRSTYMMKTRERRQRRTLLRWCCRWCLDTQSMEKTFFFFWRNAGIDSEKNARGEHKRIITAHSTNPVSGVAKVDRSFTENLHTGIHACAHTHTHTDRHVVYTWSIAPHNPLLMKNFDSFHRVTEKCYYSGWEKHGCWLNGQIGETKKKLAVVLRNTTSGYKRLARTEMGMRTALGHWRVADTWPPGASSVSPQLNSTRTAPSSS